MLDLVHVHASYSYNKYLVWKIEENYWRERNEQRKLAVEGYEMTGPMKTKNKLVRITSSS